MKYFSIVDLIPKGAVIEDSDLCQLFYRYIEQDKERIPAGINGILSSLNATLYEEYDKKVEYTIKDAEY